MTGPRLHERVARAWTRAGRATTAAVAAAIASLVAWAAGLPPGLHGALMLVVAGIAVAWPRRDLRARALRWVGARAGLAYETALEAEDRPDPTGLLAAVRTQGRLVIRDVAVPSPAPWWVPALLLATTLWGWGAWVGVPWAAPPTGGAPADVPAPPVGGAPLPPEDAELGAAEAADLPDEAARAGDGAEGAPGGLGGEGDGAAAGGAGSERDALDRFLDGLREREEGTAALGRQAAAAEDDADTREGDEGGDPAAGGRDPGREGATAPNAPDPGGDGERAEGDEDAPPGAETGTDGADDQGDERGEGAPGGDGADDTAGAPEGAADQAQAGEGPAEGAAGIDPGEDGGEAGLGAGVEGEAGDAAGDGGATPEALPSLLGPGPETPVGGVALPGVAGDADAFPAGAAGAAYRRAVEEAISEGEVPVPYQEVIRNYFR